MTLLLDFGCAGTSPWEESRWFLRRRLPNCTSGKVQCDQSAICARYARFCQFVGLSRSVWFLSLNLTNVFQFN